MRSPAFATKEARHLTLPCTRIRGLTSLLKKDSMWTGCLPECSLLVLRTWALFAALLLTGVHWVLLMEHTVLTTWGGLWQADQGEYGIPGLGVKGRGPYFSP